jgi:5-methylcytosine-specific restriction endonuclease McrA
MSLTAKQKQYVRERAGDCCEYCRVSQSSRMMRFQIDHIIAVAHDGFDEYDNLCLACYPCNAHKGSNVAALDPLTNQATRLYDPRQQAWDDHFVLQEDAIILGITPEGRTTQSAFCESTK